MKEQIEYKAYLTWYEIKLEKENETLRLIIKIQSFMMLVQAILLIAGAFL